MPKSTLSSLTQWITAAAYLHGAQLPGHLMQRLGVSRRTANVKLKALVASQWLQVAGRGRATRYTPGALRQVAQRYPLATLQEDLPWRQDFAPYFDLPPEVQRLLRHAFTELLNNAVDHSGGQTVMVSVRQTPVQVQLLVSDDGCGIFERIAQGFGIPEPSLALLELSKGKLTSDPGGHCGHGLYVTARLADVLCLHANGAGFQRRAWDAQPWRDSHAAVQRGTSVYVAIALDTPRRLEQVLGGYALLPGAYAFERTEVPLQLLAQGQGLASRAEARRALARLDQFRRAEINFAGVRDVGQGFADEMFRVYRQRHPGVELVPLGMNPQVAAMVDAVRNA